MFSCYNHCKEHLYTRNCNQVIGSQSIHVSPKGHPAFSTPKMFFGNAMHLCGAGVDAVSICMYVRYFSGFLARYYTYINHKTIMFQRKVEITIFHK